MVTYTQNKNLTQQAYNDPTWNVPNNANFTSLDAAFGGITSINVTGVGTGAVALTSAQYVNMFVDFTGTLSNNVTYQLPASVQGRWLVRNSTSGAFTITFSSATGGGSSVVLPTAGVIDLYCDGTNVISSLSRANVTSGLIDGVKIGSVTPSTGQFTATSVPSAEESKLTTGTSTAYALTTGLSLAALTDGLTLTVNWSITNGTSATLNVDALGAAALKYNVGGVLTVVAAGQLIASRVSRVVYNSAGSCWEVTNGLFALSTDTTSVGITVDPAYVATYSEKYYGTNVFSGTGPTSYADLDLSGTIGAKRCRVVIKIATASIGDYTFRTKGETAFVGYAANNRYGAGVSGATIDAGNIAYIQVITDTSGFVQWKVDESAITSTLTLLTAQEIQ